QLAPQPAQLNEPVDRAQQVISWNVTLERELIEQRSLFDLPMPHHDSAPLAQTESATFTSRNRRLFQHNRPEADFNCLLRTAVANVQAGAHCICLMPASRITLAQRAISRLICAENSSGVLPTAVYPIVARRSFTSGSMTIPAISR